MLHRQPTVYVIAFGRTTEHIVRITNEFSCDNVHCVVPAFYPSPPLPSVWILLITGERGGELSSDQRESSGRGLACSTAWWKCHAGDSPIKNAWQSPQTLIVWVESDVIRNGCSGLTVHPSQRNYTWLGKLQCLYHHHPRMAKPVKGVRGTEKSDAWHERKDDVCYMKK